MLTGRRTAAAAHVESLERRLLLSAVGTVDLPAAAFGPSEPQDSLHGGACGCAGCAYVREPVAAVAAAGADIQAAPPFPLADTFNLHSLSGADFVIYLDFNGHTTSGTNWNTRYNGGADVVSPAYDADGNPSSFNDAEREWIQRVWQRVAEDFAPFNVDVTTEDPGVEALRKTGGGDTKWGIRSIQTGDQSWLRDDIGFNIGGIAYLGSFSWDTDTPCFTFNGSGSTGLSAEMNAADTHSHEIGHTVGLSHDGRTSPSEEYYRGHGTGPTGWAPIMGAGFGQQLSQWSRGEYPNANQTQDDLRVITDPTLNGAGYGWSGLTYRADDHADEDFGTVGTESTALTATADGLSGSGLIGTTGDVDSFWFDWGGGSFSVFVSPAERGPNLDILAGIYDAVGALVASSNPVETLNASITNLALAAGRYYLRIDGVGKPSAGTDYGYSDYGSLGRYTVLGSDPTDDRYEENDSRATAVDPRQSLGTVPTVGEWEQTWLSAINGVGKAKDEDWYAIEVTAGYLRVRAELSLVNSEGDLDLFLVNSVGTIVASAETTANLEIIDVVVAAAGRYYLRVMPWPAGSSPGNSYDLRWDDLPASTPNVSVDRAPGSVTEDGATNLVYTFTRTGPTAESLTVTFNVSGTAAFGVDYAQTGAASFSGTTGTVTFAAGSATATVTIDPTADGLVEADETVVITVVAPTGYALGTPSSVTGTITNDDAAPNVVAVRYGYGADRWVTTAALAGRIAPWEVARVQVTFDRDVSVDAGDLVVSRLTGALGTLATTGFAYDAATGTATWTLAAAVREDRIRVTIDGDGAADGNDGVQGGGAYLAGGDFLDVRLDVLFGDVNGTGTVTVTDAVLARNAINTADVYADVNGTGTVTVTDAVLVRNRINAALPPLAGPTAPALAPTAAAGPTATRSTSSAAAFVPPAPSSPAGILPVRPKSGLESVERDRALEFVFAAIGAAKEEGLAEALLTGSLPAKFVGQF